MRGLTAITRAARRAASGGRVAAESVTVDSAVVRRVQFEDHGVEVLAIQRVCAGENRGGLASSRRPVEEQVRQLSCVDQASDSRDDVLVRDEVGHVLGTVPVRGASRRPGEYTEGRERESDVAPAHFSTQGSDAICASLVFSLCDISRGASSTSIAVELPSAI